MEFGDKTNATKGGVPWHVSVYDITLISGFQTEKKFQLKMGFLHMIRFLDFKVDQFLDSWISADSI